MQKVNKLTESDLNRLVKRILTEQVVTECVVQGDTLCAIKCRRKIAKKGCPKSTEVKQLQNALAKGGFFKGEGGGMSKDCANNVEACDGIYDWRTRQAVIEFQNSGKGGTLNPDGVVGYYTLTGLENAGLLAKLNCNCKDEGGQNEGGGGGGQQSTDIIIRDCTVLIQACIYEALKSSDPFRALLDCLKSKGFQFKIGDLPILGPGDDYYRGDAPFKGVDNSYQVDNTYVKRRPIIKRNKIQRPADPKRQQPSDCPEYVKCMTSTKQTDPRCNSAQFKTRCPYTKLLY